MSNNKVVDLLYRNSKFIKLILLIIGIAGLLLCGIIVIYYHTDEDLTMISKYSAVICNHDKTPFLSEVCEKCDDSVFISGKLFNIETGEFDNFIDVFGYSEDSFPRYTRLMLQWAKLSDWLSKSILVSIMAFLGLGIFICLCKFWKFRYKLVDLKKDSVRKDKKAVSEKE